MRHTLFVTAVALLSVACKEPTPLPVAKVRQLPDSANQVLFGVKFNVTEAGIKRAAVLADTAYMYEDNTRTELRKVTTDFFTLNGEKNATLTGLTGTYNSRLGTMEARGNVVVLMADGRRLETPQLRFDPARNEVSSDSAFVLTDKERKVAGIGFISDPDMNNIRVLRAARSSGHQVTLPRQ